MHAVKARNKCLFLSFACVASQVGVSAEPDATKRKTKKKSTRSMRYSHSIVQCAWCEWAQIGASCIVGLRPVANQFPLSIELIASHF